jgi:hypothetical protein
MLGMLKEPLSLFTSCSPFSVILPCDFNSHDSLLCNELKLLLAPPWMIKKILMKLCEAAIKRLLFRVVICRSFDKNLILNNGNIVATNFKSWIIRPCPITQAKSPGMPGTGDRALLNMTATKRGTHVGAEIIDGEKLSIVMVNSHTLFLDFDGMDFSFR